MAARHRKCPTPAKKSYPSSIAASAEIRKNPASGLRVYKCRSHWHTTSSPRSK